MLVTRGESAKLLALMYQLYPNAKAADNPTAQAGAWALVLDRWSYQQMEAALAAFSANDRKGFPPSPGQLIDMAVTLTEKGDDMTEQEAWAMVQAAITNGYYGYREEYERLPEIVRACVGSPNQLREWAMTDASTVSSVIASNFMRSFRAKKESRGRYARTPDFVRAVSEKLFPPIEEKPALTEGEFENRKQQLLKMLDLDREGADQ